MLVSLAVGSSAVVGAVHWREREEAARLVAEAEHLLSADITTAPTLEQLPAARARMLLEEAVERAPEPRTRGLLAYATALDALSRDRRERVREEIARARAGLGDGARLHLVVARLALLERDDDARRRELERALAIAPADPRVRLAWAEWSLERAPAETLAIAADLVRREPDSAALHTLRGLAHAALGDADAALADFERALDRDATDPLPYVNRGRLLRERGHHTEAEQCFSDAIARGRGVVDAWLGRGLSRVALGDLDGGAADIEHARSLAPAEPLPLLALGDVWSARGDAARAVALYRAALVTDPAHAVAWLKLGNALMRDADPSGARDAFQRASELRPDLAAAHNGLGAARMRLGDTAGADQALGRAAALDENDPNPWLNLAALRERQGDASGARDAWAGALARGHLR
jgi:tetratricopeptide (TPR) repeat protein